MVVDLQAVAQAVLRGGAAAVRLDLDVQRVLRRVYAQLRYAIAPACLRILRVRRFEQEDADIDIGRVLRQDFKGVDMRIALHFNQFDVKHAAALYRDQSLRRALEWRGNQRLGGFANLVVFPWQAPIEGWSHFPAARGCRIRQRPSCKHSS